MRAVHTEEKMSTSRILRTRKAASYVGLSASTLEKMRLSGDGPRFVRLGRVVGYDVQDLDAWIDQRRAQTSRPEPAA